MNNLQRKAPAIVREAATPHVQPQRREVPVKVPNINSHPAPVRPASSPADAVWNAPAPLPKGAVLNTIQDVLDPIIEPQLQARSGDPNYRLPQKTKDRSTTIGQHVRAVHDAFTWNILPADADQSDPNPTRARIAKARTITDKYGKRADSVPIVYGGRYADLTSLAAKTAYDAGVPYEVLVQVAGKHEADPDYDSQSQFNYNGEIAWGENAKTRGYRDDSLADSVAVDAHERQHTRQGDMGVFQGEQEADEEAGRVLWHAEQSGDLPKGSYEQAKSGVEGLAVPGDATHGTAKQRGDATDRGKERAQREAH